MTELNQSRPMSSPSPGYFKVRAWSRGPWLPARIARCVPRDPETGDVLDRGAVLMAFIHDNEVDIDDVWLWGRKITLEDYAALVDHIELNPIEDMNDE